MSFDIHSLGERCRVCNGEINQAISLKDLPFTGVFALYNPKYSNWKIDQALMICEKCGHGQLKNMLESSFLYGDQYSFRTSNSITSMNAAGVLISYLDQLFGDQKFERVVDFGCNDAYLLTKIKDRADQLLGIDLIWKEREQEFKDTKISVTGEGLENIDFESLIGGKPDLVMSQHTMEHVQDPVEVMEIFSSIADANTVFLFEFPCFDLLLEHFRIDQIFHEHLQYYSLKSFHLLLAQTGFEVIDYRFNPTHWGAVLIAFKKHENAKYDQMTRPYSFPKITCEEVKRKQDFFNLQVDHTRNALKQVEQEGIWGYGAALMLPVLGYHLKTDFSQFKAILDDDPDKNGSSYANLPVSIQLPGNLEMGNKNIFITALDNKRPILKKLLSKNPKRIINWGNFI